MALSLVSYSITPNTLTRPYGLLDPSPNVVSYSFSLAGGVANTVYNVEIGYEAVGQPFEVFRNIVSGISDASGNLSVTTAAASPASFLSAPALSVPGTYDAIMIVRDHLGTFVASFGLLVAANQTLTIPAWGTIQASIASQQPLYSPGTTAVTLSGSIGPTNLYQKPTSVSLQVSVGATVLPAQTITLTGSTAPFGFSTVVNIPAQTGLYYAYLTVGDDAPTAITGSGTSYSTRGPALVAQTTFTVGTVLPSDVTLSYPNTTIVRGADGGLTLASDGSSGHGGTKATSSGLPTGAAAYSVSCWVQPVAQSGTALAVGVLANVKGAYGLNVGAGAVSHLWGGGSNDLVYTTSTPFDGAWHHLVATWDGTTRVLYLDGATVAQDTPTGLSVAATPPLSFLTNGYRGGGQRPAIWSRALTGAEVAQLYSNDHVPQSGLVGYWPLVDNATTLATDVSGNGNTLACVGMQLGYDQPRQVKYRPRSSLLTTGAGQGAAAGASTGLPTTGAYSFATWLKLSATSNGTVLSWGASTPTAIGLRVASTAHGDTIDGLIANHCGFSLPFSQATLTTDTRWHRALVTFDGTTRTLYVDNNVITTDTPGAPAVASGAAIALATQGYLGWVQGAAIWNRALTLAEVALDYNGAKPRNGLVAAWDCDDGSGTTLADTLATTPLTISGGGFSRDVVWYTLLRPNLSVDAAGWNPATGTLQMLDDKHLAVAAIPDPLDLQGHHITVENLTGYPAGPLALTAVMTLISVSSYSNPLTLHLQGLNAVSVAAQASFGKQVQQTTTAQAALARQQRTLVTAQAALLRQTGVAVTALASLQASAPLLRSAQVTASLLGPLSAPDQALLTSGYVRLVGRLLDPAGHALARALLMVQPDLPAGAVLRDPTTVYLPQGATSSVTTAADGSFTLVLPLTSGSIPAGLIYLLHGPYGLRYRFSAPTWPATLGGGPLNAAWLTPPTRALTGAIADIGGNPLVAAAVQVRLLLPAQGALLPDGSLVVDRPLTALTDANGAWSVSVIAGPLAPTSTAPDGLPLKASIIAPYGIGLIL